MDGAGPDRRVAAFRRRLEAMGLECRDVPGGRSLLVRLPATGGPLSGEAGAIPVSQFVFSTVGANRIKCLVPRPLFLLPLLGIADCESAGAIEARIREGWQERRHQVGQARAWLEKLGCELAPADDDPICRTGVGGEHHRSDLAVLEPGAVILPSAGPLAGIGLDRPEDRIFRPDADLGGAVDLDLAVSTRMEELIRLQARLERQARKRAMAADPAPDVETAPHRHRILLVGRRLLGDTGLIESLRMRGYRVTAVRGAGEALRAFEERSFELVLVESELDRFEGIEMVPSVRALPGIEELPLVLVDARVRPELRETARRLGAAGYVTHPIDVPLIEAGLTRLLHEPRRRRFTRYPQRLGARAVGASRTEITHEIGRGGMLVKTDRELAPRSLQRYALSLPDGEGPLRVDVEVVYHLRPGDGSTPAIGIRFERFPDNDEERLIAYLHTLAPGS